MKNSTKLRELLSSSSPEMIMESHSGLSAKIAQETGFKAVWASSLSISASYGLRDCNEASWSHILETVEFMTDSIDIPLLLDADTGYGNFNNVRYLVKRLENRRVGGMCIEDKLFPKTNSFINGERQSLADVDEFCGKIKAAKDTQVDPDFNVIARIEALIAGYGMDEALTRAHKYVDAGADALLVHSKSNTVTQIAEFMGLWDQSCPIVVVPTKYYDTPFHVFEDLGISVVIWANQMMRASITSMQDVTRRIYESRSISEVEPTIVPVSEVFRLQNTQELLEAELNYLQQIESVGGIILAASKGDDFEGLTKDKPKAMVSVDGKPILSHIQDTFNQCGVKDITVLAGYAHESVKLPNIEKIIVDDWQINGNAWSLYLALHKLNGPCVISFGDILFDKSLLDHLLDNPDDIVLSVDYTWTNGPSDRNVLPLVQCDAPASQMFGGRTTSSLTSIGYKLGESNISGEWIGLLKVNTQGAKIMSDHLKYLAETDINLLRSMDMVSFLHSLSLTTADLSVSYFPGKWLDVDNSNDLTRYNSMKD